MELQIIEETETQYKPIFIGTPLENVPGGVTVIGADLPVAATTLDKGIVVGKLTVSPVAGEFHICKTAEVHAGSSSTSVKVKKNQLFKVNDYICNGTKSVKISAIVTTHADYDTLTVTAITVTAGMILFQSTSAGTEAANIALKYTPAGITKSQIDATNAAANSLTLTSGVVVRGTVNESLLPYPVATIMKTSLTDRIRFA